MRTTAQNKMNMTRKATALTLVLALGVAVYLNWEYAKADTATDIALQSGNPGETPLAVSAGVHDQLLSEEESLQAADKNYGEAQLVSISKKSGSEFFEQARLSRTKSYDDAVDKIQKALKSSSLSETEKADLTAQLKQCLENLTEENEIETLVKAKGFADCVCFLRDGAADLTVMTGGDALDAKQVAQIRDIVLSKCAGISAQDITVVEVK